MVVVYPDDFSPCSRRRWYKGICPPGAAGFFCLRRHPWSFFLYFGHWKNHTGPTIQSWRRCKKTSLQKTETSLVLTSSLFHPLVVNGKKGWGRHAWSVVVRIFRGAQTQGSSQCQHVMMLHNIPFAIVQRSPQFNVESVFAKDCMKSSRRRWSSKSSTWQICA